MDNGYIDKNELIRELENQIGRLNKPMSRASINDANRIIRLLGGSREFTVDDGDLAVYFILLLALRVMG